MSHSLANTDDTTNITTTTTTPNATITTAATNTDPNVQTNRLPDHLGEPSSTKSEPKESSSQMINPIEQDLALTATDYKNTGNKLCSQSRYEEALKYYSKAISKDPEVGVYFSNRGLCHLKLQRWPEAIHDCRRALELEPNLIKAHFFLGQALAGTGNYDDALKHLQCAHELARESKMNFGDDITCQIRLIKRHKWMKQEDDNAQFENELKSYLLNLVKQDTENKQRELRERLQEIHGEGSSAQFVGKVKAPASSSSSPSSSTSPNEADILRAGVSSEVSRLEAMEAEIKSKCDNYLEKLEAMFNSLTLQRRRRDVPDYLCGKISFEIMHDPVITPSGITYERKDIEEHLSRVGHFDPITRQHLVSSQLIPNLAMKEVIDAYLGDNEWAYYQ